MQFLEVLIFPEDAQFYPEEERIGFKFSDYIRFE